MRCSWVCGALLQITNFSVVSSKKNPCAESWHIAPALGVHQQAFCRTAHTVMSFWYPFLLAPGPHAGLPMSALVSDLGPLGLGLGSAPDPDSMDPFAVEAAVRVFSPQVGLRRVSGSRIRVTACTQGMLSSKGGPVDVTFFLFPVPRRLWACNCNYSCRAQPTFTQRALAACACAVFSPLQAVGMADAAAEGGLASGGSSAGVAVGGKVAREVSHGGVIGRLGRAVSWHFQFRLAGGPPCFEA